MPLSDATLWACTLQPRPLSVLGENNGACSRVVGCVSSHLWVFLLWCIFIVYAQVCASALLRLQVPFSAALALLVVLLRSSGPEILTAV